MKLKLDLKVTVNFKNGKVKVKMVSILSKMLTSHMKFTFAINNWIVTHYFSATSFMTNHHPDKNVTQYKKISPFVMTANLVETCAYSRHSLSKTER